METPRGPLRLGNGAGTEGTEENGIDKSWRVKLKPHPDRHPPRRGRLPSKARPGRRGAPLRRRVAGPGRRNYEKSPPLMSLGRPDTPDSRRKSIGNAGGSTPEKPSPSFSGGGGSCAPPSAGPSVPSPPSHGPCSPRAGRRRVPSRCPGTVQPSPPRNALHVGTMTGWTGNLLYSTPPFLYSALRRGTDGEKQHEGLS